MFEGKESLLSGFALESSKGHGELSLSSRNLDSLCRFHKIIIIIKMDIGLLK